MTHRGWGWSSVAGPSTEIGREQRRRTERNSRHREQLVHYTETLTVLKEKGLTMGYIITDTFGNKRLLIPRPTDIRPYEVARALPNSNR